MNPNKSWKNEIQKFCFMLYSKLDGLANGITHNPLGWIYQSAKID